MRSTWTTITQTVAAAVAPRRPARAPTPARARDTWTSLDDRRRAIDAAADPHRTWIPRHRDWVYGGRDRRRPS